MPLVHMLEPLVNFFSKLISAAFDEPLESLIGNIPDLDKVLVLDNKEMNMSVEEFISYEMGKPESPYKTSMNMIQNYKEFVKYIEEQNAAILEIIRKEKKDAEYFERFFAYLAEISERLDKLDLQIV